jgi:hypothetical protein
MSLVRLAALALASLLTLMAGARADVQGDLKEYQRLNGLCRGGSGDKPETVKACEDRDRLFKQVENQGWCWGPKGVAEYQKQWRPCRSEFEKSKWALLKNEDRVAYYLDTDSAKTKDGRRARIVADGSGVPAPMRNFAFTLDCKGRFRNEVLAEQYRVWEPVKPDSLIAVAENIVCSK